MTLGAAVNQKAQPVVGNEIILFRTHSEILTDQRIIVRGNTYPLDQIARAYVRPAWYYVPFQVMRLAVVVGAVLLLLSYLNIAKGAMPGNPNLRLLTGALMGLVAVMATWLVPTHALLIKTASGRKETVIWGHDAGYLRVVRDKIITAARSQQQTPG